MSTLGYIWMWVLLAIVFMGPVTLAICTVMLLVEIWVAWRGYNSKEQEGKR